MFLYTTCMWFSQRRGLDQKFRAWTKMLSFRLFSSLPPPPPPPPVFKRPSFMFVLYVLLRLNAWFYAVKYEEQICSQLSICSPRQILLHYDNVKYTFQNLKGGLEKSRVFVVNQPLSFYIKLGSFLPQTYLFLRLNFVKSLKNPSL